MWFRPLLLLLPTLVLGGCVLGRAPEPKVPPARWTTSPNGEPLPFRAGQDDCRAAISAWFATADRNADGMVDIDEMVADAARWFAVADLDHDSQITADELSEVRRRLLPEPAPEAEAMPARGPDQGPPGRPQLGRSQARVDTVMQADANADFRVSAAEFRAFVIERMAGRAMTAAEAAKDCR